MAFPTLPRQFQDAGHGAREEPRPRIVANNPVPRQAGKRGRFEFPLCERDRQGYTSEAKLEAAETAAHGRGVAMRHELLWAALIFSEFAVDAGAMTRQSASEFRERVDNALREVAAERWQLDRLQLPAECLWGEGARCFNKEVMLSRRSFGCMVTVTLPRLLRAMPSGFSGLPAAFGRLEKTNGGRLGVAVLDTATGERSGYRADERFPMCSTFKFLLVSAVLQRVDRHQEMLDRSIPIPPKPLLSNSPLTEPHAGGAMTVAALCQAALIRSDNTAANLLLEGIDGPASITHFSRSIGDRVTRLDRMELSLNESLAGDPRDTTSPGAMASDLKSVLLGNVLSSASRDELTLWMQANLTGLECLRAKLPKSWRVADKTGSNGEHTANDIAVLWPPEKSPIIIAAHITQCPGPESKRAGMLAEIGRMVAEALA